MADAQVAGPVGYDIPLPPESLAPEILWALGQREEIATSI